MSYKEFPKKYYKKLPSEFVETIASMNTEEIKKRVLDAENNIFDIESDRETNDIILKAKEDLKEIIAPYSEGKAREVSIIKYCLWTLEERGIELKKE